MNLLAYLRILKIGIILEQDKSVSYVFNMLEPVIQQ